MHLNIYKNYQDLSEHVADEIISLVKNKPDAVLCLATGDSPRLAYKLMVERVIKEKLDFSRCTFIALDEWVGLPPSNEGTCAYFLNAIIFSPLKIDAKQIHLFNALSNDLDKECSKMNRTIIDSGGIDLIIVGVGMNGHVGFNEPGVPTNYDAHVINLDEVTQSVGQKYFSGPVAIKQGITLGLNQFLHSKKAIMIASGLKKAPVMQQALEKEINIDMPASIIRKHMNGFVMIDEDAASALKTAAASQKK
ncbi:MAG: glucosamine-6-phosphate deaminase [Bacteroidetes bacterium]|nr:glucosamine-6-phosphate deaminase [Bacteroidota bacterium]